MRRQAGSVGDLLRTGRRVFGIELIVKMGVPTITLLPIRRGRPALRRLGTSTAAINKLERGNFWLFRIGLFPFASVADEAEAGLFSLLGRKPIAGTMLPDVALVAGHAMTAIVKVLAVYATHRAVKRPLAFFFLKLLELLFVLLLLREALTLGNALSICGCIALGALRNSTLGVVF